MPYNVLFDKDGYILVTISSPCSRDDHYAALDNALTLAKQHSCSKILVDLSNINFERLQIIGCFNFGQNVVDRLKHSKIAHVLPSNSHMKRKVVFTSTVEANRGVTTGEFESLKEAKDWLLSS